MADAETCRGFDSEYNLKLFGVTYGNDMRPMCVYQGTAIGTLHELRVEKGSVLPKEINGVRNPDRTDKGRAVFPGDRIKDGYGYAASGFCYTYCPMPHHDFKRHSDV